MITEEILLPMNDGVKLHLQLQERGHAKWIVVTHGIGEHLSRHQHYSQLFGQYFNILYYDLRGHGRSQGTRGAIDDFSIFAKDLRTTLEFLRRDYRMQKFLLAGHSMGALITADFMQNLADSQLYPERVFLSSPPVGLGGPVGKIVNLLPQSFASHLSRLKHGLVLGGLVDLKFLSHDSRIKEHYINDPLNILKLHTSLLFGLMNASKHVFSKPLNITCPCAVIVGTEDQITSPEHTEQYFTLVEKGHDLKLVEGGRHELHNEIERFRAPFMEFLKNFFMQVLQTGKNPS